MAIPFQGIRGGTASRAVDQPIGIERRHADCRFPRRTRSFYGNQGERHVDKLAGQEGRVD